MADEFFRTPMGHRFYEGTMPGLVRELKRLNDNIERMLKQFGDSVAEDPKTEASGKPEEPKQNK